MRPRAPQAWVRRGRGFALAGVLTVAWLGFGAAWAAPPVAEGGLPGVDDPAPKAGDDGTLPPPPGGTGGAASAGDDAADEGKAPDLEPPVISDADRFAQRTNEFEGHLRRAEVAQKKGRHDEAIREFTAALELEPGDPTALLGRAYSRKSRVAPGRCPFRAVSDLKRLGTYDPRGAWVEQRQVVLQWMADCPREAAERLAIAKELAGVEVGSLGRPPHIRALVAELSFAAVKDLPKAEADEQRDDALAELQRYREECQEAGLTAKPKAIRLLADIHRERDELSEAKAIYDELLRTSAGNEAARGASKLVEDIELELSLRELEKTQGWKPSAAAEASYTRGVEALRRGDLVVAQSALDAAIEDSRWFPRAYHARGVVHARNGRFLKAVQDLKRAIRMDRSDYEAHIKLGLIYKKEFAGAEDPQAITHLEAALRLRPDLHRLHLFLGELYGRTDRERAREHYSRFLQLAELDDPDADQARQALQDLERDIRKEEPPALPAPAETALRSLDPKLQRLINEAYLRGTEHQDWRMAEKILQQARDEFADEPVVLNQLARVVYAQERWGSARDYWEQSLQMDERQMEVHERLGLLLRDDLPDRAIEHLRRAAELGSLTARYVLADLLWSQTRPLAASEQLDRYIEAAGDYDLHWDRAQALREEIDRRFLQFYLVAGLVLGIATIGGAWRIWRRYRGSSLSQLLERDPKSFPEVALILSLIRHEILKHNTAFLADVGQALEFDAPDADTRAAVLAQRLFGGAGAAARSALMHEDQVRIRDRRGRPAGGIYGRFLGYLAELEKVARAHRVTLNLYRKDAIFRPMIKAFEELAARADQLHQPERLRTGKRMELARMLGRSGHVLGRQAFERLSGLIRELCVVTVDRTLVAEIYAQVAGEEQFASQSVAPLEVSGSGAQVRIFRTDLEDILANVLRNSLRSSLLYATPPVGMGIDLRVEEDEITGLTSLAMRVKDRSPEQLSNEMLRGRYVERGMGITVDLLSRYDGAISVEAEPGWSKAVVLRFFTVEEDGANMALEAGL
ncbi:MAG: tetratricopeptide repeat protein [Myxococcota bacterium]